MTALEMKPIATDLYQFSTFIKAINLTFHQYLLFRREPVLFHTGNIQQATALVPELKSILAGIPLKYSDSRFIKSSHRGYKRIY